MNFTFQTDEGGASRLSKNQMIAFETAGRWWSRFFSDNATVNIHVDMTSDLPQNVIGGALPDMARGYGLGALSNTFREKNQTSYYDQAVANYDLDGIEVVPFTDGNSYFQTSDVAVTTAQFKALGDDPDYFKRRYEADSITSSNLDGVILMSDLSNLDVNQDHWSSNNITWHAGASKNVSHNAIDLVSVAIHEVGHVLGFVSGVDSSAWNEWFTEDVGFNTHQDKLKDAVTFFDLYRRGTSVWHDDFQKHANDMGFGGTKKFQIMGGEIPLGELSTGKNTANGGDGYQGSHWKLGNTPNIMDPAIPPGERRSFSWRDLKVFDVLGWELKSHFLDDRGRVTNDAYSDPSESLWSNYWYWASNIVNSNQSSMVRDRLGEVSKLLGDSYEGRGGRGSTRRQELLDIFTQEALFSSFDTDNWQIYLESINLNELGTSGEDIIGGDIGNDRLQGKEGDDLLKGYEGDDLLKGNQGSDRLIGGEGNDTLIGGNGDDILKGEAGDDLLKGSAGIDVLIGGAGADTFVIDDVAGFNVIRDFTVGEDSLQLAEGLDVTIGQRNNHTTIALASDDTNLLAVLRNVDSTTISLQ